jgi:hypothetical protein
MLLRRSVAFQAGNLMHSAGRIKEVRLGCTCNFSRIKKTPWKVVSLSNEGCSIQDLPSSFPITSILKLAVQKYNFARLYW